LSVTSISTTVTTQASSANAPGFFNSLLGPLHATAPSPEICYVLIGVIVTPEGSHAAAAHAFRLEMCGR
jgi:hypothetical protein